MKSETLTPKLSVAMIQLVFLAFIMLLIIITVAIYVFFFSKIYDNVFKSKRVRCVKHPFRNIKVYKHWKMLGRVWTLAFFIVFFQVQFKPIK